MPLIMQYFIVLKLLRLYVNEFLYYFTYFFLLVQKTPIKPKNPLDWAFLKKKPGFFWTPSYLDTTYGIRFSYLRYVSGYLYFMWLNGLVVSSLGIQAREPGFDSQVMPLFHWVATLGKLFTHIASTVSQLRETGVQKGSFRRLSFMVNKCTGLS